MLHVFKLVIIFEHPNIQLHVPCCNYMSGTLLLLPRPGDVYPRSDLPVLHLVLLLLHTFNSPDTLVLLCIYSCPDILLLLLLLICPVMLVCSAIPVLLFCPANPVLLFCPATLCLYCLNCFSCPDICVLFSSCPAILITLIYCSLAFIHVLLPFAS